MSDTVVDTRDLSMRFGGVQAVNNVNFSLADRELRCLIGPNGAGKSTFFKCLTGQIRLDHSHGRVFIRGQDVTGWRAYEIVRLGVGIKTQVPSVMNGLSVEENLWLSARRVGGLGTLLGPIVGAIVLGYLKLLLGQQTLFDNSLVLGAILILVVLLLPSGLLPALSRWRARRDRASVSRRQASSTRRRRGHRGDSP